MGDELESNTYPGAYCENRRNPVFGGLEVIPQSFNYILAWVGCLQARLPKKIQRVLGTRRRPRTRWGLRDPVLGRYAPPGVCLSCS